MCTFWFFVKVSTMWHKAIPSSGRICKIKTDAQPDPHVRQHKMVDFPVELVNG
jgi:hypothetical protein